MPLTKDGFCRTLDATSISPLATKADMEQLLADAEIYPFFSVIGPRCFVPMLVAGTKHLPTIAGSGCCGDDGCEPGYIKAYAAADSIRLGAGEIDMVMNLHYFKSGMNDEVVADVRAVKDAIGDHVLKCIIESPMLSDDEITLACNLVVEGGADFVKTSIGAGEPTTVHQIEVISKAVKGRAGIKASGGVRTLDIVRQMIDLGVTRFGIRLTSATAIMAQLEAEGS